MRAHVAGPVIAACTAALMMTGCATERGVVRTADAAPGRSSASVGDGAPNESENQRFRDRMPVAPASRVALDAARIDARRGLRALGGSPSKEAVRTALASAGAPDAWVATGDAGSVVFEAQVAQAGCLIGSVSGAGRVVVETGGFVADGGCHALTGH